MNERKLTVKIAVAMLGGIVFGVAIKFLSADYAALVKLITDLLTLGGNVFLSLMKLLVVPSVLVSIICGICSLEKVHAIGRIGLRSFKWFIITTVFAILLAMIIAQVSKVGSHLHLVAVTNFDPETIPSFWQLINDVIPSNIFQAMADANMLQIIVFAMLLGIAINLSGAAGRRIALFFVDLNDVIMRLVMLLMEIAPYGTFCLLATLFINQGFELVVSIFSYFIIVVVVLLLHTFITLSFLLRMYGFSPAVFFRKFYPIMLFAFGVSSSTATIPIAVKTMKEKFGVDHAVASFVIPLGINVNKNGTAIMQCVAAIFIAYAYHINLGFSEIIILVFMILLNSIGTAGVPGIGIIALAMILKQLGLPTEGIALIIGVDRLLDMLRTTVNVISNAIITCLVARAEDRLDYTKFRV